MPALLAGYRCGSGREGKNTVSVNASLGFRFCGSIGVFYVTLWLTRLMEALYDGMFGMFWVSEDLYALRMWQPRAQSIFHEKRAFLSLDIPGCVGSDLSKPASCG